MGIFNRVKFIIRSNISHVWNRCQQATKPVNKERLFADTETIEREVQEELDKMRKEREAKEDAVDKYIDPALAKYYEILGLKFGVDLETVTKRWKELASTNHPDKFTDPALKKHANDYSAKISEAFNSIKTFFEKKRKKI